MAEEVDNTDLGDEQLKEDLAKEAKAESQEETKPQAEEDGDASVGDSGTEEETATEEQAESTFEDTDEPEIPSRNASHIIQRQRETIEKLRSKEEESQEVVEEEEADESAIDKAVKRQLTPFLETISEQENERELSQLLDREPEAKNYQKAIRAYMKHPSWNQVPAEAIFHHLHYGNAQSVGAKRKANADIESEQSGSGAGSTRRPTKVNEGDFPSADEIEKMSDEELDELTHRARMGEFVPKE